MKVVKKLEKLMVEDRADEAVIFRAMPAATAEPGRLAITMSSATSRRQPDRQHGRLTAECCVAGGALVEASWVEETAYSREMAAVTEEHDRRRGKLLSTEA
eukprot:3771883-Heterocapsa_arctica.AAC.1